MKHNHCENLESLDLSNWDTSNVKDMMILVQRSIKWLIIK